MSILLLFPLSLCSCRCQEKTLPVVEKVETDVRHSVEVVWDTAYVDLPAQYVERQLRDTVSRLETDFAVSEARVSTDGTLFHSLGAKQVSRPVRVAGRVERRDSVVYREKPVVIYRDRQLTRWQQLRLRAFVPLLLLLLLLLSGIFLSLRR